MSAQLDFFAAAAEDTRKPCFHCGTPVRTVLIIQRGARTELPCCFNVERGCDAAARHK